MCQERKNTWAVGLIPLPREQAAEKKGGKKKKPISSTPKPSGLWEEFPVFADFPALRPADLEVFAILLRARGKPVHRSKFRQLTGRSWESTQSHISSLRKGLQNHPGYPGLASGIHSIPHHYSFVLPERLVSLAQRFQPRQQAS